MTKGISNIFNLDCPVNVSIYVMNPIVAFVLPVRELAFIHPAS